MAENINTAPFSVIVTTSEKLPNLIIKNGQLVFIKDMSRIAFDFNDRRTFYNQITELDTEYERKSLESPLSGYYFIIETAILWHYKDGWIQITGKPDDIVFIGTELPELGQEKTLYVDKAKKEISVYDTDTESYLVVADKTDNTHVSVDIDTVTEDDINALF